MKKTRLWRIIATVMTVMMLTMGLSVPAFADDTDQPDYDVNVYVKADADADATLVATFSYEDLAELATSDPVSMQWIKGGATNVITSTQFVTFEDLFAEAGIVVDDTCVISNPDYSKFTWTWSDIKGAAFYGDASGEVLGEPTGTVTPGLALTYAQGSADTTTTADAVVADLIENGTQSASGCPRIFVGIWDTAQVGGNRSMTGMLDVVVTGAKIDLSNCNVSANDITYTGEAADPDLSVRFGRTWLAEDTDYTVALFADEACTETTDAIELGTYYAKVTGIGAYTGEEVVPFEVIPFFTLYYKANADAEAVVAAQWESQDDFEALAKTEPTSGMMFKWTVLTSIKYITVEDIIASADIEITMDDDDTIAYAGRDGWGRTRAWSAVNGNFYPNAVNGHTEEEAAGAYATPAVIALNYAVTAVNPDSGIANAAAAMEANVAKLADNPDQPTDGSTPRFLSGVAEYNFTDDNAWEHWGWTQGNMIASLTITDDLVDISDATIKAIPDQLYTGEPVKPSIKKFIQYDGNVLKEGVDYTLSFEDNTEVGTATMTITGIGAFTGSVTREFNIIETTLDVYVKADADSEAVLAGTYTLAELREMAGTDTVSVQYGSTDGGPWTVFTSTSNVALSDIFDDLGITVDDDTLVTATASDGFSSSYTWGDIDGAAFYGDSTSTADFGEATGTVEPSIVLSYAAGGTDTTTTAVQAAAALEAAGTQSAQLCPRIFVGIFNVESIGGNRFASSVNKLTVTGAEYAAPKPTLNVYAGATRYDVSTMISDTLTADESFDGIVVVSGENGKFADALSASGLAGLLGYPLVVLNGAGLTDADRATLANYAGDDAGLDIVIIGGNATVTEAVAADLSAYGTVSQRIAGADRYEVNANVYDYGTANGTWGDTVFVARGDNFPDALTIAPYMVSESCPIILVNPKATELSGTQRAIAEGASRGVVLGGTASVTEALQSDLAAVCGEATRLGGADRYEASANIVTWELSEGMSLEGAGFATGAKFPDALGSGFILGSDNAVLCLVDARGANDAMRAAIAGENPSEMNVFGGTASVPEAIYDQMADAVGWGTAYEKVQK